MTPVDLSHMNYLMSRSALCSREQSSFLRKATVVHRPSCWEARQMAVYLHCEAAGSPVSCVSPRLLTLFKKRHHQKCSSNFMITTFLTPHTKLNLAF